MLKAAIRLLTARIKGSNIVDLRTIPVCINNEIFPRVAGNFPVFICGCEAGGHAFSASKGSLHGNHHAHFKIII